MRLSLSFEIEGRLVEIIDVHKIQVQDYMFTGKPHVEKVLVVDRIAYELARMSDIRLAVHVR